MVIHRKWSSNEDMGFGEIWYDVLPAGADRWDDPDKNADCECGSLGPHASGHLSQQRDGGTGVFYHDGLRIGTTRAVVEN
jgi:hypothetical protein